MNNLQLIVMLMLVSSSEGAIFPIAKPGCNDTCAGVKIPYPFGIGPACALSQSYTLVCTGNSITPTAPRIHIKGGGMYREVLRVSLSDQTITLNVEKDSSCPAQGSKNFNYVSRVDVSGTPFVFSRRFNKMMMLGCANALLTPEDGQQAHSGCTSMCDNTTFSSTITKCYGINCCEASIPFDLTRYWMNFTVQDPKETCVDGFLVDLKWKPGDAVQYPYVPVVFSWTLPDPSELHSIPSCSVQSSILELESGNVTNYNCECKIYGPLTWFYNINPYLDGACDYATSILSNEKKNSRVVIVVGASVGVGVLFLMASIFVLYKVARTKSNTRRKKKFFERNGGLLLERQLSAAKGVIDETMVFNDRELMKATDGFNENRILGQGGQGTVYKGMLSDGRIVAIKKSKKVDEGQLEQFINEVVLLSQVNHRNVVKLLGCCLETDVPMLVYEHIPNGTLHSLIHNTNSDDIPFTWNLRLRIAAEVAGALAHLHSAISIPIFHRDVKSSNILLDEKYISKVSDFGTSMSVATDKTHLTTKVKGTFGYLDPEYFQSSQFTEKSDVYSFGVVLAELLTRQKPISSSKTGEDGNLSLAARFFASMDQDSILTILDPLIMGQRNDEEVFSVAKLAHQCLHLNGKKRPTMKEVAVKLENIKFSSTDATNPSKFHSYSLGQEGVGIPGDSTGTTFTYTTGSESIISFDSDVNPLLHSSI